MEAGVIDAYAGIDVAFAKQKKLPGVKGNSIFTLCGN
jgi:hypothetical protein